MNNEITKKAIIELGDREDRIVTILKGKFGLKNKSDVINFVIQEYEENFLQKELRPVDIELVKKIRKRNATE